MRTGSCMLAVLLSLTIGAGRGAGAAAEEPAAAKASPELVALFGETLTNSRRGTLTPDELAGKTRIGIYFSAHWCPPCRAFTPKLVDAHRALQKQNKPFEVVFVSSDRSERDMQNYMRETRMPWLAVPYDSPRRSALASTFGVRGIPRLVIIDGNGKVVSQNAVGSVSAKGAQAYEEW